MRKNMKHAWKDLVEANLMEEDTWPRYNTKNGGLGAKKKTRGVYCH
jgi:hypothetical protein